MSDVQSAQTHAPSRRWQWGYLLSVLFAGVWEALLNAPSGYAPILCGSRYPGVPCASYSWLDAWPQWFGALMWFVPIALSVVFLVLLFKCGTQRELLRSVWWLCGFVVSSIVYINVHHWHLTLKVLGVHIDDSALHRWDVWGLFHFGLEYAVLPLSLVGIVILLPTWFIRRRRERRGLVTEASSAATS